MKEYFFVDLETTANGGPSPGTNPEAHWDNNKVLLCGYKKDVNSVITSDNLGVLVGAMGASIREGNTPVFVAHNAKFDIKYMMREYPDATIWGVMEVWDTMTWEYLHSGHRIRFISLEEACDTYGLKYKKSLDLGALIKGGLKMEDIPLDDLRNYLIGDVQALNLLWAKQYYATSQPYNMQYILPLAAMELNGLHVDIPKLNALYSVKQQVIQTHEKFMMDHITQCCEWQDGSAVDQAEDFTSAVGLKSKEINMFARRTMSFLLTGCPSNLEVTTKWKLGFKKPYVPTYGWAPSLHPSYFVGETHLGYEINERVLELDTSLPIQWKSNHAKAEKIVSTYLGPMSESAQRSLKDTVHPKLNTAQTATGRLSSSQPNGQNMPPIVRELIRPHDKKHRIYEIDFKQLEMVAVACISGCTDMIKALVRGDDLHYLSGKRVMGWTTPADMTKDDRRTVKAVNFGVLYGGKAAGLSAQTGVDKRLVQSLIDGFFRQFPGVGVWQKKVFTSVVEDMYPYDIREGEQRYASLWTLPLTGRRFTFIETLSPGWLRKRTHRKWSFSPTQTSNYPIQGCAGGDLVMYALYWLWQHNPQFRFLLTVHDSIIIETSEGMPTVVQAVNEMCAATTSHFKLQVPLSCDVDSGTHWK